jgi:hypothetical protein
VWRHLLYDFGIIFLTLWLPCPDSPAVVGRLLTGNQGRELQEVRDSEMGSPTRQHLEGAAYRHAGPGRRQAPQLPGLIVEVDAIFAPRGAPFQQLERAPAPGMKGMGDPEKPLPTERIRCS